MTQFSIFSYDGNSTINNGSAFEAYFPEDAITRQVDGSPILVERRHFAPQYIGQDVNARFFPIFVKCLGTLHSQRATLSRLFDTFDDSGLKTFIVKDTADSNKQWQLSCRPVSFKPDGQIVVITMCAPDAIFRSVSQTSDAWPVTASGQTHDITTTGTRPVEPIFEVKPTSAKSGGLLYKRNAIWYNPTAKSWPNHGLEITSGGLDTATLVSGAKMQADGDDLRVFVDGVETNRWFGASGTHAINQSATYVWIVNSWSPKIEFTIAACNDSITTLTVQNTVANKAALARLPVPFMVYVGTELITGTGKNLTSLTLTGCTRGAKGTTAAAHSAGDTTRWIEHHIEIAYGDSTLSAPTTDDTYKPIFSLNSTNAEWTYTGANFATRTGKRAGEWKRTAITSLAGPTVPPPKTEHFGTSYSSTTARTIPDTADPFAVLGVSILAWQYGTTWKADGAALGWLLYHPGGITALTWNGYKWRISTSWPVKAFMQKSNDGAVFVNMNTTLATPASASTWTAFTGSPTSLSGTYNWVRFLFSGSVGASANNEAAIFVDTCVVTLTNVLVGAVGSEQTNTYQLALKITNNTSGEYIMLNYLMKVNQTLKVDCLNHAVTLKDDNSNAYSALSKSTVRNDWLNLAPGTTVTLQADDTGTGNLTITTLIYDRTH